MHYSVAAIVDGNLPRAQASRLAAAAMRARHRFHCRAGGVLWDGFSLMAVRRASETVGFEAPQGFVTVSPERPTSKRDPRWYEHPRDECTVFDYDDEAGCDAAWKRWQDERPSDWVFVQAIRAHYTGSRGAPPGRKLAWVVVEDGEAIGVLGLGEPPYKLAARRRLGIQDARPLPGTACNFIFRRWGGYPPDRPSCARGTQSLAYSGMPSTARLWSTGSLWCCRVQWRAKSQELASARRAIAHWA